MEGYRVFRGPVAPAGAVDLARRAPVDYSQAMFVALAFYVFGHAADLATTIGFLSFGRPECNYIPALVLEHGGLPALIVLKVVGAAATTWVLWRVRQRAFTVVFACLLAVILIFVASINSLDVLEALAQGY